MAYRGGARSGKTHGKITLPIRVNITITGGTGNNIGCKRSLKHSNSVGILCLILDSETGDIGQFVRRILP